jgi:hypothetical protein
MLNVSMRLRVDLATASWHQSWATRLPRPVSRFLIKATLMRTTPAAPHHSSDDGAVVQPVSGPASATATLMFLLIAGFLPSTPRSMGMAPATLQNISTQVRRRHGASCPCSACRVPFPIHIHLQPIPQMTVATLTHAATQRCQQRRASPRLIGERIVSRPAAQPLCPDSAQSRIDALQSIAAEYTRAASPSALVASAAIQVRAAAAARLVSTYIASNSDSTPAARPLSSRLLSIAQHCGVPWLCQVLDEYSVHRTLKLQSGEEAVSLPQ